MTRIGYAVMRLERCLIFKMLKYLTFVCVRKVQIPLWQLSLAGGGEDGQWRDLHHFSGNKEKVVIPKKARN